MRADSSDASGSFGFAALARVQRSLEYTVEQEIVSTIMSVTIVAVACGCVLQALSLTGMTNDSRRGVVGTSLCILVSFPALMCSGMHSLTFVTKRLRGLWLYWTQGGIDDDILFRCVSVNSCLLVLTRVLW